MKMLKTYRVYICSTHADLIDERKGLIQALLDMGCLPIGTEIAPAYDEIQKKKVEHFIDDCDLFLLIIAGRYGSVTTNNHGDVIGYTEREFDYAVQIGKPILAFVHNNLEELPAQKREQSPDGKNRLSKFREKVQNGRLVKYWDGISTLKTYVVESVRNYCENNTAITSSEILNLLWRIDSGDTPTAGELDALHNCTTINLKAQNITALPDTFYYLQNLQRLILESNPISSLPESVWRLTELEFLNLSFTKVVELPKEINGLIKLKDLWLVRCNISDLPDSIGELSNLQRLILSDTKIEILPRTVCSLSALQILYISGTKIKSLPESITSLTNLQCLNLSRTYIEDVPEFIGELSSLQVLALRSTPIKEIPDNLAKLCNLTMLDLGGSSIGILPSWIGNLASLTSINLNGLILPSIPKSLALRDLPFSELETEEFIDYIDDYPFVHNTCLGVSLKKTILLEQSRSIFLETPGLISSLYMEDKYVTLRESRVIFLGDGGTGKSYTIRRIRNRARKETKKEPYITSETPGVEILDYQIRKGRDSIRIHFWDFGGQQLLHSMHRCFLSDETCYVITVKTRETKANDRARFWLHNVIAFAPNAPILLYINCWGNDDGRRTIDEPGLLKEFPCIKKVVYCSAKEASDDIFQNSVIDPIVDMVASSEWVSKLIPQKWVSIRQVIEKASKKDNYLTRESYHKICTDNGINNERAPTLLSYFNHIGICFSYHVDYKNNELAEYKLLNPVWLTNAIYAIIEEGRAHAADGKINLNAIKQMLCNRAPETVFGKMYHRTVPSLLYKEYECPFIIDIAIANELCYQIDRSWLFFPALCDTDTPDEALTEPDGFGKHVRYLLRYEYLPDSVLHRLMIRCMQNHLSVEKCWLHGMVIYIWELHRIIVRMVDDESLQIDIYSTGEHRAYELFWVLRKQIEEINRKMSLAVEEYIIDGKADFLLEDVVTAFETNGIVSRRGVRRNARELLGDFYDESIIQSMRVENGMISVFVEKKKFTRCKKSNKALRMALYETYHHICPYCGNPLSYREMEVDHILPASYTAHPSLKPYIEYLNSCGFNTDEPDYVENYFPSHGHCNRDKSNRVNEFTLPYWHMIAWQKAKTVMLRMKQFEKQGV